MLPGTRQGRSEVLLDEGIVRLDFRSRFKHEFGFVVAFKFGERNTDGDGCVVVARIKVEALVQRCQRVFDTVKLRQGYAVVKADVGSSNMPYMASSPGSASSI